MKLSIPLFAASLMLLWTAAFSAAAGQSFSSGTPSGNAASWSTSGLDVSGSSTGAVKLNSESPSGAPLSGSGASPGYASPDDLDQDDEDDSGVELDEEGEEEEESALPAGAR